MGQWDPLARRARLEGAIVREDASLSGGLVDKADNFVTIIDVDLGVVTAPLDELGLLGSVTHDALEPVVGDERRSAKREDREGLVEGRDKVGINVNPCNGRSNEGEQGEEAIRDHDGGR